MLQNEATGQSMRLTPVAYQFVGLMDGERSVDQIWREAAGQLGDQLPGQDEVVGLLSSLHQSDALVVDAAPDYDELLSRRRKKRSEKLLGKVRNPFAVSVPLIDPDNFLEKYLPLVRPLFSIYGLMLWLALVLSAAVVGLMHAEELFANVLDRTLTTE
ncbi:MAG: peptidase M50, partial [Pseudomonadota bacterium]